MKFEDLNLKNVKIVDKYILRQVVEIFILGVVVFSSITFASQVFIDLIKQITDYGLPPKIAFMIIILNLPAVFVMSIPMSMLLATIMGLNKLCLSSEITVMRSCGIGLDRISKPIFAFALLMTIVSFGINEFVAPYMGSQSKTLAIWALGQKNIPDGKKNYTLKEMKDKIYIKRFFYVQNCTKKELENVSVIDFSDNENTQIIQASKGETSDDGWVFKNASVYTIDKYGRLMNTSWVARTTVDYGLEAKESLSQVSEKEYNFIQLAKHLRHTKFENPKDRNWLKVKLHEKLSLPVTTFILAILGIPLAITPPRARYNRGFILSIVIILFFYILTAVAESLCEAGVLPAIIAAWIPNIVFGTIGIIAYRRKVYKIN